MRNPAERVDLSPPIRQAEDMTTTQRAEAVRQVNARFARVTARRLIAPVSVVRSGRSARVR